MSVPWQPTPPSPNGRGFNGHRPNPDRDMADPDAVRQVRQRVAARLERLENADRLAGRIHTSADEQARARAVIAEAVENWVARRASQSLPPVGLVAERAIADAVYAALYGLGRLQALLDRENVENIHIHGHDRVAVELADGGIEWWPHPVADSDAELVEMLASFAARAGQTSREFSSGSPILNLRLPAGGPLGSRLAAVIEVVDRPHVTIRRHRLSNITLDDLYANCTISEALVRFLRAAVRSGKNMVISGGPAAGKTTLLRALANEIPPDEHLVTVEDEYELGLHLMPQRHPLVTALECRTPNAEAAGGIDMDVLLKQALRHSPNRVIVGEVRAGEVTSMLRALGNGAAGGMCTLHAVSAGAVFDRVAALGQLADPPLPIDAAYRWIASAVDLVVHLRKVDYRTAGRAGRRVRHVTDVLEVGQIGDAGRPDTTRLFATPAQGGQAVPDFPPSDGLLADLERAGFHRDRLAGGGAPW